MTGWLSWPDRPAAEPWPPPGPNADQRRLTAEIRRVRAASLGAPVPVDRPAAAETPWSGPPVDNPWAADPPAAPDEDQPDEDQPVDDERDDDEPDDDGSALDEDTALDEGTALDELIFRFGLTPFERDLLLLAVAAELDPRLPPPSFELALATLPDPHWSATLPTRPLRAARLIALGDGPLLTAPLRADERVVHHLQGIRTLDDRLAAYLSSVDPPDEELPASRREAAAALKRLWGDRPIGCLVSGPDQPDRRDVIALAASASGLPAWSVAATDLPRSPAERDGFARLWSREAVLTGAVLVIEIDDPSPEVSAAVEALLARLAGCVVVSAAGLLPLAGVAATLQVSRPSHAEQADLWQSMLPRSGPDGQAETLADEFDLAHSDILRAPVDLAVAGGGEPAALARARSLATVRHRLAGLAERIEPCAGWDDLVLPPAQLRIVKLMAAAAGGRRALHQQGAGRVTPRGLGISALFAGPSGTGKTLAAEVVAGELGLDLHRVDLASIVSKWVGETEKHLRQVFDAAEQGGTVLLFDEADALFGRRSEVRDSHDRYANLEVSYLLQRMENYRGVAILTSNLRAAIDPAFLRRLRFVVQFPHPGPVQRRELWRRALPDHDERIDLDRLGALDLTGGEISTVATHARLLAGAGGDPVGMEHLRDATVAELVKLERPLADLEAWR